MPDLSRHRHSLKTALIVVGVLDVIALGYLLSPLSQSRAKHQEERDRVQQEFQVRQREVAPLKNLDQKLVLARREIADFYTQRIPAEYSVIPEELGKLAKANSVRISTAKYGAEDADIPGLQRVKIDATIDGDYVNVVRFINAMERDKIFFIIDSVGLSEQSGGAVKLQVRMETYLRSA